MIDGEEDNLNAENVTDCADKYISDDVAGGLITTAINASYSIDFLKMLQVD